MSPENTRVWRKTRRQALRGVPTGRRATHPVQTTYGEGQRRAAWLASWAAAKRERDALAEATP
jgi:hypothetical protein